MFIEINKINSYGEKGIALVKLEDIMGVKEYHVESEKFYDEDGNVVQENPRARDFGILVVTERGNQEVFHVDEVEYQRVKDILTNPTK